MIIIAKNKIKKLTHKFVKSRPEMRYIYCPTSFAGLNNTPSCTENVRNVNILSGLTICKKTFSVF